MSATRRSGALGAAIVLSVSLFGGTGAAYWSSLGGGTGSATAAPMTFSGVSVTSSDVVTGAGSLYPDSVGDVLVRYSNTSSFPVRVASLTMFSVSPDACGLTSRLPTTFTDSRYLLQPGTGSFTVPGGVHLAADSASACQGSAFTLSLSITVRTP